MDQGVINKLKINYRKRVVLKQVRAIEKEKAFNITILDALRMLYKSWMCVLPATISNCFRHAGFVVPEQAVTIDDENNELDDIPLAQLASMGNGVMLKDFVEFNETLPTKEDLADDDTIFGVLETRKQPSGDDSDDEDLDVVQRPPPTIDMALDALSVFRDYYQSKLESYIELHLLSKFSRDLLKDPVKAMNARSQSSMYYFITVTRE